MDGTIDAVEAQARLSRLLRAVEQGEHVTITVRGRSVADLVPHGALSSQGVAAAIDALRAFPRIRGVSDADSAGIVGEGRR